MTLTWGSLVCLVIVSRRDLLWKAANIKDKNNSAAALCWEFPDGALSYVFCSQIADCYVFIAIGQ